MSAIVVNRRKERETLYIGRGSIWGNPFTHIPTGTTAQFVVKSREESVWKYCDWVLTQPQLLSRLMELDGHKLGCFCKPQDCHGDILVWLLNGMKALIKVEGNKLRDWSAEASVKALVYYAEMVEEHKGYAG